MGIRYKKNYRILKNYILLIIIFLIGIVLGSLYVNKVYITNSRDITPVIDMIDIFILDITNNSASKIGLFRQSALSYSKQIVLIWVLGLYSISTPIIGIIIAIQGFSYGFTTTCFLVGYQTKGLLMSLALYGIQGSIFVCLLILVSNYIMSFHKNNKKINPKQYVMYIILSIVAVLLLAVYESYISQLQLQLVLNTLQ